MGGVGKESRAKDGAWGEQRQLSCSRILMCERTNPCFLLYNFYFYFLLGVLRKGLSR